MAADPSQNDYADTIAAPYSIRPYHIPTVSTPLEWKEVNEGLSHRVKKKGDLFKPLLEAKKININRPLIKLLQ